MVHENDGRDSPAEFMRKLGNPEAKLGATRVTALEHAFERTE